MFGGRIVMVILTMAYGVNGVCQTSGALTNDAFRNAIVQYALSDAHDIDKDTDQKINGVDKNYNFYYKQSNWTLGISCYQQGQLVGTGTSQAPNLVDALASAYQQTVATVKDKRQCRYTFDFSYYPHRHFKFISYGSKGLEMTGNRLAQRVLTKEMLHKQVALSTEYLLRSMNPAYHGFFKYYDATTDKAEPILRTIYTSSSLFSLILIDKLVPQLGLEAHFKPIAQFILNQQLLDGPQKGAFYYSFNPQTKKHAQRVVVGTTSKTIFTLIKLHERYPSHTEYLNRAQLAGDWLAKQVHEDGKVTPVYSKRHGQWVANNQQSLLYSGQVLSALSRLYLVTKNPIYKAKASLIAQHFLELIKTKGYLLGDEYRPANSISTSWVLMSLLDYSRLDANPEYTNAMQHLAEKISTRQRRDVSDLYYLGDYYDALSTSGNGWINEVFGEYYQWCQANKAPDCQRYKKAMLLTSRWLIQNAYTKESAYQAKNPEHAEGGFIRRSNDQVVRTDAVCHGVNSLVTLAGMTKNDPSVLLDITEPPLESILLLLRIGEDDYGRS